MANIDSKQAKAIVEKMSPSAIDTYAHLFLLSERVQPIKAENKGKVTPQQIEGFISASPYGAELGFFAQMLSCSGAEELNAFYAGCDKEFFKNASVLLSRATINRISGADGPTMAVLKKLSMDATDHNHRLIGEAPNNLLESDQLNAAKARYVAANGKAIDRTAQEAYLNGIAFDQEKLEKLEKLAGAHPDSMITFEFIDTDNMTTAEYDKFLADKEEAKKDYYESGLKPVEVSGNYTHSRNSAIPLYLKTDYVTESFITQLPTALNFCKDTKVSLKEYAKNPSLIFEQASEYSNGLFVNKYEHAGKQGTMVDFLVLQWLKQGAVGIVDTSAIAKHSDITMRTLLMAASDENQLTTEQLKDKLSLFTDRLYQRPNVNPRIIDRDALIAAAKYKNITDIVKDVGYHERPTLPQADKFEYLSNLSQLHNSLTNTLVDRYLTIDAQKANETLEAISVELSANKLSFGDRFFHPIKSAAVKRELAVVQRNVQRAFVANTINKDVTPAQNRKLTGLFTDKQVLLARELKLNTLDSRVPTRNNLIRMAMCDKLSQEELFAEEPSQRFIQAQDVAMNEIRTAVDKGDVEYFKNLFVKAGAFINSIKIPEVKFDTPQHAAKGLRELDKISVFSKDFEQIQGGKGDSTGKVFYEHADPKFVETVFKNAGTLQCIGQATKDALLAMQRMSAQKGAPISREEETALLRGAAGFALIKTNIKNISGHTVGEIDLDPMAVYTKRAGLIPPGMNDFSKQSLVAAQTILADPTADTSKLVGKLPRSFSDIVVHNVVPEAVEPFPKAERQKLKEVDKNFAKTITKPSPGLSVDVGKEKVNEAPVMDKPSK